MTQHASPILTSLLDTDAYKLHMQQAVYHRYRNLSVAAEFRCRGDELLGSYANEIIQQVALMGNLALTDEEYNYLSTLPFFKKIIWTGCAIFALTRNRSISVTKAAISISASLALGVK